ncbi:UNVERIFIED_CONTAM: hypothetical protein GTU68_047562 [Idotea baltica]|nr:hypothetical protein [Idotea baltica]
MEHPLMETDMSVTWETLTLKRWEVSTRLLWILLIL